MEQKEFKLIINDQSGHITSVQFVKNTSSIHNISVYCRTRLK